MRDVRDREESERRRMRVMWAWEGRIVRRNGMRPDTAVRFGRSGEGLCRGGEEEGRKEEWEGKGDGEGEGEERSFCQNGTGRSVSRIVIEGWEARKSASP